ncbi:MAG TPA: NAD-dependent epimerase/dehydratase family protein [Bosea sp. (in: a-proteobacteria)]|nr:NAD-dependent epimerase/dehydratase family protein [Bosea sp. (in: a-proteobacteria)]
MTKHIVLGGRGFIGRHVALLLARRGDSVKLLDRAAGPAIPEFEGLDARFIEADITASDWYDHVADCEVIHHYAWSTVPATANADPLRDLDQNVRSTLGLLEALRTMPHKTIIFASSGGTVYGRLKQSPVLETHPLQPTTAYGVSKLSVERYLGYYRSLYGMDCRIARIANPYGAGQNPHGNQGAASAFLFKAMAGEPIDIWGDGAVVRDYIHISDLAQGLARLTDAGLQSRPDMPIFNLGSGQGVSLNDIVAELRRQLDKPITVHHQPGRSFDIPVSVLDISLAVDQLAWRPRLDLAAGYRRTIADLQAGRNLISLLD